MLESKGEKVFDVNEKDNQGMTPLYYAAENENSDIIAALINKDANLSIKGNEGKTPMTILMEKKEKFTIVVKILGLKLKSKNHCDRDLHAIDREIGTHFYTMHRVRVSLNLWKR